MRCEINSRKSEYEWENSVTDYYRGFEHRKISAKMVLQILTDGQKQLRLHISSDLLYNAEMFDKGHYW
jgi:hypothetical protein